MCIFKGNYYVPDSVETFRLGGPIKNQFWLTNLKEHLWADNGLDLEPMKLRGKCFLFTHHD